MWCWSAIEVPLKCLLSANCQPETEVCRERGSTAPAMFLRVRTVFALNILVSIIFGTRLESLQVVCKLFKFYVHFPYCLESSQSVLKVSRLYGNFPECLENFQIFRTVSLFSRMFMHCVGSFSYLCGMFLLFWNCPILPANSDG